MVSLKSVILLISLLLSGSLARYGCRLCKGRSSFAFTNPVSKVAAEKFLKDSMGTCATGGQYIITSNDASECVGSNCKVYDFWLTVYRYCGNGSKVTLSKFDHGSGGIVAHLEYLELHCTQSVECAETCVCAQCGC